MIANELFLKSKCVYSKVYLGNQPYVLFELQSDLHFIIFSEMYHAIRHAVYEPMFMFIHYG